MEKMKNTMRWLMAIIAILICVTAQGRPSWKLHAKDMYAVFGFEETPEITEWMRYVSSYMIDGHNKVKEHEVDGEKVGFYDYLKHKFPDFKCHHRLLFHWGYNSRPWTPALQAKVDGYSWDQAKIQALQQELVNEQARRNRIANEKTENLFGFAHGGRQAALARAIVSIAYDVHILGDYVPDDNKDLTGLCDLPSVIGDIINNLRVFRDPATAPIERQIRTLSRTQKNDQHKALDILNALIDSDFDQVVARALPSKAPSK